MFPSHPDPNPNAFKIHKRTCDSEEMKTESSRVFPLWAGGPGDYPRAECKHNSSHATLCPPLQSIAVGGTAS